MNQKLIDQLTPDFKAGRLEGVLATTYELDSAFVDDDFFPAVLGVSTTSQHKHTSRLALQRALAELTAATVLMDARCYRGGRPSLRVEVIPRVGEGGAVLHAKVTLIVQPEAVRLLVGSANLTDNGHRRNREVAALLTVTKKDTRTGPLVAKALALMPELLERWWTPGADAVWRLARTRLVDLGVDEHITDDDGDAFVWSDGARPLWSKVVDAWPKGEAIERVHIVSPFWSVDDGAGPLSRLLAALKSKCSIAGADVVLCAPAEPFPAGHAPRPCLPSSYAALDLASLGVKASARAVVAAVDALEAGSDDVRAVRALHAKVLVLEGKKTTLAYCGSANFTASGYGLRPQANVEAGLLLLRRGKARAELTGLIPPLHEGAVLLNGAASSGLAVVVDEAALPLWPTFLAELRLVPAAGDPARLVLRAVVEGVGGAWTVKARDVDEIILEGHEGPIVTTALAEASVNRLLIDREARVFWWSGPADGAVVPLNVDAAARDALPLAPGLGLPGEDALLAYYQGRLTFEQLFPSLEGDDDDDGDDAPPVSTSASEVDTSGIQSYQVRSFIEALPGMERELALAKTPAALRFALRGPVSLLALARNIEVRVNAGTRSKTAGAFQIVEMLALVERAARVVVDVDARAAFDEAAGDLEAALANVSAREPSGLGAGFQRYERRIRRGVSA